MEYFDERSKTKYVPHVIEPSLGVDRLFLAIMVSAYHEDEVKRSKITLFVVTFLFGPCFPFLFFPFLFSSASIVFIIVIIPLVELSLRVFATPGYPPCPCPPARLVRATSAWFMKPDVLHPGKVHEV